MPGVYSLSFRGYINGAEAGVGTLTSDGAGNATVSETWINLGTLCTTTTSGTYSVNDKGWGVISLPFAAQSCSNGQQGNGQASFRPGTSFSTGRTAARST
jgi:hypothetical protein